MTAAKLSSQDRKDLDKFTRFLAYKIVQVVVQSRLGVKIKTESKPHSSSADWFNLSIQDLPEVQSESKRALDGQIPTIGLGMCVEISLKTMEGDTMVLETWYLEMTDQCDPGVRVTYTVYNRMSTMLKSLLVMTRVTPAYKLSQLQGSTTFVICYRVYMGEPQYNNLGDNYSRGKVGQVGTPVGTLLLSVAYRTQMTISPQKANKDGVFMVKSDHFNPEMSPKCPHRPCGPNHNVIQVTDQKSVMDELASACEDCQDDNYRCPMVMNNCHQNNPSCVNGSVKKVPSPVLRNGDACPNNIAERQISFSECMKVGAFVDRVRENGQCDNGDYIMPDPPFANLLKTMANAEKTVSHLNSLNKQSSNGKLSANCEKQDNNYIETEDLQRSRTMVTSGVDDFVMVDLKPPFACGDEATDLGAFFRECQTAPQLLSFNEQPSFAEQVNELGIQLAKFETSVPDFDDFVETLCLDETSK